VKVKELKEILAIASAGHDDDEVVIEIKAEPLHIGGTPFVKVKDAWYGFDWEHGKFYLTPSEELRKCQNK